MARPNVLAAVAGAAALTVGCVGPRAAGPSMGQLRGMTSRCGTARGQSAPLLTEWSASEKADFEVELQRGGVAVAYSGCTMQLVPGCRVQGVYRWMRTTTSRDSIEINDQDQLYAKLPLGAVSLEGDLKRWGKLAVQTSVSGQLRLDTGPQGLYLSGNCEQATHIVTAVSLGAFSLSSGGGRSTGAGVTTSMVGAGGDISRDATLVRGAGDPYACAQASDSAPNPQCASPIQAFLAPLPGRAEAAAPPGTVKVDLVSANASSRWDVYVDDSVVCTTPCSRWLDPNRPVFLRTRDDGMPFSMPDRIQLSSLENGTDPGPVQLQAYPTARGELAAGFTFTSLGGMGLITGIALTSVGCSMNDSAMCRGGGITMAAGAVVTAGAIWLILDALPHAEVRPLGNDLLVDLGPGSISGRF